VRKIPSNLKDIKVDIISGFLGAGKTTLLKKLIREAFKEERIIIIENEYGEINIDSGFLAEYGIDIKEMTSGCICCSLVGDFQSALYVVAKDYKPDRIIIEPSGVGKTSDIIEAIRTVSDKAGLVLNLVLTVADVTKYEIYAENFGEFFDNQISNADAIVLSRAQYADNQTLEHCMKLISNVNNSALISTAIWSEVNGAELLRGLEAEKIRVKDGNNTNLISCNCDRALKENQEIDENASKNSLMKHSHEHTHHHADEIFSSVTLKINTQFTEASLKDKLEQLNKKMFGQIIRAKGTVCSEKGNMEFDFVPGEVMIRAKNHSAEGVICVIGIGVDKAAMQLLFGE